VIALRYLVHMVSLLEAMVLVDAPSPVATYYFFAPLRIEARAETPANL